MLKQPHHDLFGEVPVLWCEVEAWVFALVGLSRDSWRWNYYVRYWNVAEKIRMAKIDGTYDAVLAGEFRTPSNALAFAAAIAATRSRNWRR
jgi:hypothetical protein